MSQEFQPSNDLERVLLDTQEGRATPQQFIDTLMASEVFMPVYEKHQIGGFVTSHKAQPLTLQDEDSGSDVLVLFTGPERAKAFVRDYPGYEGGLASNGFGEHSPGGYSLQAGFVTEVVMTLMFLFVIIGATDNRAPAGFGPIAIGLCLTLIHLISIPVTNTSVNPARSTGPALLEGGIALQQLWLFWVAPLIGAAIAAVIYKSLFEKE